jgi:hypothetical protein
MIENAKIKVQIAKSRNPDLVGMGVLVVGPFSISRILYLLDAYYTSYEVGCQVNSSLTTDFADFADYRDLGIRVYKCMRIYLWGAI